MLAGQQADMQVIKGHYCKVKKKMNRKCICCNYETSLTGFSTALLSDVISFPFLTALIKTVSLLLLSAALTSCLAVFPYAASPFCSFLSQRTPPASGLYKHLSLGLHRVCVSLPNRRSSAGCALQTHITSGLCLWTRR